MARLKVLYLVSSQDRFRAECFATHLHQDEFDVQLCALDRAGLGETPDIPTTFLGKPRKFDIGLALRLRKVLAHFQPDIIHTWRGTETIGHFAALALKTQRTPHTPQFVNDSPLVAMPPQKTQKTEKRTAEELLRELGIEQVEPTGEYYSLLNPQYDAERQTYRSAPPPVRPVLIGLVNRFTPAARLLDALWVFETFNHIHLNFHAFFIGEGPELDQLLRYREAWKLTSRVHLFSPAACRGHNLYGDLISHFDVLLNLSYDAAESDSIPDTMLYGVPVIVTAAINSTKLVTDGVTGILVPESGSDFRLRRRTFAEKTLRLLEDETLRQTMRVAAKEYVTEHFDIGRVASQYAELYRNKSV